MERCDLLRFAFGIFPPLRRLFIAQPRNCKRCRCRAVRLLSSSVATLVVMAREKTEAWDQLATRITKDLHRRLKLHCVTHEIAVQDFVTEAIEEKLGRKAKPKKGPA